ncbi:hypothetical protein OG339_48625 (plasmid) [Streptosporangium sp. NBC_01495]|uniref:hypothetical protein n=1 Tax=Streptosporangium sp. NBC_01495 TaxID=2903899 RepID=UPI002E34F968|nr:hypothetical protein [Streptosporangium sp. NBC_01495]
MIRVLNARFHGEFHRWPAATAVADYLDHMDSTVDAVKTRKVTNSNACYASHAAGDRTDLGGSGNRAMFAGRRALNT